MSHLDEHVFIDSGYIESMGFIRGYSSDEEEIFIRTQLRFHRSRIAGCRICIGENHYRFVYKWSRDDHDTGRWQPTIQYGAGTREPRWRTWRSANAEALSDASGTMEVVTEEGGSLHVQGGRGEEYKVIYGHLVRHPLNLDLTDPSTSVLTVDLNNFSTCALRH